MITTDFELSVSERGFHKTNSCPVGSVFSRLHKILKQLKKKGQRFWKRAGVRVWRYRG